MNPRYARRLALAACIALFARGAFAADEDDALYARGRALFNGNCHDCHAVDPAWLRATPGPTLYGVIGRKAGTVPTYRDYSDAMMKSGIVWNAATIQNYISNPRAMVPGNKMAFIGVKNADDRKAIVAYIAKENAAPPPPLETTGLTMQKAE